MSLSNFFLGEMDDDPIFGHSMRQMNRMLNNMNNMLTDPFGGMFGGGGNDMMGMGMGLGMMNMAMSPMAMMNPMMQMTRQQPGLPGMNFNRLTTGAPGMSFSSSSVYSVSSSGPNGRPQVYQETRSIRNGPDGVREQIETVQDSVSGKKKMSIGHHIGERGHVLEKEQNLHTGEREEREELINLDEDETDEFERDFSNRTRQLASGSRRQCRIEEISSQPLPAIQSAEDINQQSRNRLAAPRKSYTSRPSLSPLALPSSARHDIETSVHPHPYNPASRREKNRSSKMKNQQQQQHHH